MTRKAKKGAPEKEYHSEFMSLYDLLTSIDKHLSSIEGSVSVIRKTAEDTKDRKSVV